MTPKEKANELVDKYRTYIRMADKYDNNLSSDEIYLSKQCSIIAVNEIIAAIPTQPSTNETERIDAIMYWIKVKQEIEKI